MEKKIEHPPWVDSIKNSLMCLLAAVFQKVSSSQGVEFPELFNSFLVTAKTPLSKPTEKKKKIPKKIPKENS